jgi:UDP-3-O-[3-hydroxymyristoyl] glucosamine N-acyltransferase
VEIALAELARKIGGTLEGDGTLVIRGVAGVREAREGDLSFVANPRYAPDVAQTRASAVIVDRKWDKPCSAALIRCAHADRAFAEAAMIFAPKAPPCEPGVHPSAVIAPDARLGEGVSVGPLCVVEAGAVIGDRTVLRACVYVGFQSRVGSDGLLHPNVSIRENCAIGDRVILHNGVVVGSDGFGYTVEEDGSRRKIPQIGTVEIGDDVEIGANTTVDRARFGCTRIGNGVKIDNLVQIGHNVQVGDYTVVVAQTGIAGSTEIGRNVILAGQSGIAGHLVIGDGAVIGGQSGVGKDVPPGETWRGSPARPIREMMKADAALLRLPQMKRALADLEARVRKLEGGETRPG